MVAYRARGVGAAVAARRAVAAPEQSPACERRTLMAAESLVGAEVHRRT
jgi:hypothetical protein